MNLQNLEPEMVWKHFSMINAIPRASKKEERIIQYMLDFGNSQGFETYRDAVGNVVIKKAATQGFENRPTVILQSHLDMVHQKNADVDFDFDSQGIQMIVENDWVRANGTTLGADNGIGVAMMMTILTSREIEHPALEFLFTIDEETGMTGAQHLDGNLLSGSILLNLDTEEDDEIDVGCAGGIDTTAKGSYNEVGTPANVQAFEISLTGMKGGHSGMEIHLELGNANKLMNRLLSQLSKENLIQIASVQGGGLRNAIPRESFATVIVENERVDELQEQVKQYEAIIQAEYKQTAPDINLKVKSVDLPTRVMTREDQKRILQAIYACFNGVFSMSKDIEGLVETSSNLAKITIKDGQFEMHSLQRSSVESAKFDVAYTVAAPFHLIGCQVTHSGSYPGWKPEMDAPILKLAVEQYKKLFNSEPKVVACHAGLECGLLKKHLPNTQMISFGPTILGAHSPQEKVSISSVQKFWKYLLEVLKNIE